MSEPTVEVVPVVELPEQIYTYQPVDEFDRPIGGKQVIKYRTQEELTERLVKQNGQILTQLRKVTRDQRLGINQESEVIPEDAERFDSIVEFKPKPLSAEERFQITQDLNDPDKFTDAQDRLFESAIGVKPSEISKVFNDQQLRTMQLLAKQNFDIFAREEPAFYSVLENQKTLTDWMFKNTLAPTVNNFKLAYSKLKEAALLLESPVTQQALPVEPNTQVPAVPEARISPEELPVVKRPSHVPSSLNERTSSSDGAPVVDANAMTLVDIEKLSAEEYGKRMRQPAFRQLVDKLEKEAADRRRQKASQQ